MQREDLMSWLSGPKSALKHQGIDLGFPGERLGMPVEGSGSIASMGRRSLALVVDWAIGLGVVNLVPTANVDTQSLLILEIFAVHVILATAITGASIGQRLCGIGVRDINGSKLNLVRIVVRTLLLCLVIPALIWDRDQRGLHDKAVRSAVIRLS
ncbi:MAG: RDD family protein [Actinobacteria bacterium]|uniref:Unannotated protein n=1 Tax=freshwater metagenome TaxID=449393 RepID=A0A6J5YN14_9ZZZZ|nr:RDD family protein [Actinomycetota bacterium]